MPCASFLGELDRGALSRVGHAGFQALWRIVEIAFQQLYRAWGQGTIDDQVNAARGTHGAAQKRQAERKRQESQVVN